jgi:hypothetical protein
MASDEFRETTDQAITKSMLLLIRLPLLQSLRHCEFLEKLYDGYSKVKKEKTEIYILSLPRWGIFLLKSYGWYSL